MKADKKGHQKEVHEIKSELRAEKDSVAVVVYNLETIIHYLRLQLKDAAECKARSRALESSLNFNRVQAQMLEKQLSKMEDALHKQKEEAQETLERYQASQEDQLEGKTRKVAVAAALKKKPEQQFERQCIKWQEDKSSLLQATENLRKTLQDKEQEWKKTKSSTRFQLEDLWSQITKQEEKK
ncbi:hypothetical protein VZT92_002544 [Zoarces viviparus]|uniref:Uncharacterized protein n=1 Tax=Zoarces viviparus TaxID=48416 RepID=A0AAW1FZ46_ZOAVI